MDAVQKKKTYFTYKDYMNWSDDVRVELIDGQVYDMSPVPSPNHQGLCLEIASQFHIFLKNKPCKVFASPIDVRLNADKEDDTIVQPDIIIVCDKAKIGGKNIIGAPDFVLEILSPSTSRHDKFIKFNRYLQAEIREYWIVDPQDKTITANIFKGGEYVTHVYGDKDTVPVAVLDGCDIKLEAIFPEEEE